MDAMYHEMSVMWHNRDEDEKSNREKKKVHICTLHQYRKYPRV